MIGYTSNIEQVTKQNNNFRQVLYTGKYAQLVVMNLNKGEEISLETHPTVDQFFRIESGTAKIVMNGEENIISSGMVAIVPAGTEHVVTNIGEGALKLYTIYCPPNHPANTVHATLADAVAAEAVEHASN